MVKTTLHAGFHVAHSAFFGQGILKYVHVIGFTINL